MPMKPSRICTCGRRVPSGQACECQRLKAKERDAARPSARQRGYSKMWERAAKAFLAAPGNDRCVTCGAPAAVVDHKTAFKGDERLKWDRANWQPMCRACNSRKNVRHEGGFGNRGVVGNFAPSAGDHPPPKTRNFSELGFLVQRSGGRR